MNRLFNTSAIVVKKSNWAEKDQLITFFTRRFGKITAKARGVRSICSKRSAGLDLFNYVKIGLYEKNDYFTLTELNLLNSFELIKNDFAKISHVFQIFEILDRMLARGQKQANIFDKTLGMMAVYEDSANFSDNLDFFKTELISDLGFGRPYKGKTIDDHIREILEGELKTAFFLTDSGERQTF